ncbi:MAG: hypothetical protein ACO3MF_04555 [Acholeplasmataceae bacterium]
MDGCNFYDYFVKPLHDLSNHDLSKLADFSLKDGWYITQSGRDDVIDKVANAIHEQYVDTGACDIWGPTMFVNHYLCGVLEF